MFRSFAWKIVAGLYLIHLILLFFMDDILGVPWDKRDPIDIVESLKLQLAVFGIAIVTTLLISLIWLNDREYLTRFKFLFPRILAIWIILLILMSFGFAYYVATVKYGLQVW